MRPLSAIAWTEEAATRWSLGGLGVEGKDERDEADCPGTWGEDGKIVCLTYFCDMILISAG
jgi:hypothetical protein